MQDNNLQIVNISPRLCKKLYKFFKEVKGSKFFSPHPFTLAEAHKRCYYEGNDIYVVIMADDILGYGFLRGWDDKWADICLGVIVKPEHQSNGLGTLLMHFLHATAKQKGLKKIRLHVDKNNPAIKLYKKMGYKFDSKRENGELIGIRYL